MLSLNQFIFSCAEYGVEIQRPDGSFPAGHNGPYCDPETPVRCTAHFLYLLSWAYSLSEDQKFKKACFSAIDYLKSENVRPTGMTFHCRDKNGKDRCNGLVGQAWVIESLVRASEVFQRKDCYQLAEDLFLLHPWIDGVSLWRRVDIDGTVLPIDQTFNHQLWFAMAASTLNNTPLAIERCQSFLRNVASNVELYGDGVIFHKSSMQKLNNVHHLGAKACIYMVKSLVMKKERMRQLHSKSVGYQGFNLHALAVLKKNLPHESFWKSGLLEKLFASCESVDFIRKIIDSDYGYFYNLSGFEIALAYEVLWSDSDKAQQWIDRQFMYSYDEYGNIDVEKVKDINTARARVYMLSLLQNEYQVDFKC